MKMKVYLFVEYISAKLLKVSMMPIVNKMINFRALFHTSKMLSYLIYCTLHLLVEINNLNIFSCINIDACTRLIVPVPGWIIYKGKYTVTMLIIV